MIYCHRFLIRGAVVVSRCRALVGTDISPICMQLNPHVKELSLYDIGGTEGVACDISHCNTKAIAKVRIPGRRSTRPVNCTACRRPPTKRCCQFCVIVMYALLFQPCGTEHVHVHLLFGKAAVEVRCPGFVRCENSREMRDLNQPMHCHTCRASPARRSLLRL